MRQPGSGLQARAESGDRNLRADMRLHSTALRSGVKARHSVEAVTIRQRQSRQIEFCGALNERLGLRGRSQKAEGAGGMKFDIISQAAPPDAIRCADGHAPANNSEQGRRGLRSARPTPPCPRHRRTTSSHSSATDHMPLQPESRWPPSRKCCGLVLAQRDLNCAWRTHTAQRQSSGLRIIRGGLRIDAESLHVKARRAMRIFKHRRSHALFADDGLDARQRHIQPRRLRRLRREESELYFARPSWFSR